MKNTSVWLNKTGFVFVLILFIGCATVVEFQTFHANTPDEALRELLRQRESITAFKASCVFEVSLPDKNFSINGEVLYTIQEGWHIEFQGPLGLKIAVIEADSINFSIHNTFTGRTETGRLDETLELPNFNLTIPRVDILIGVLLPVLDIYQIEEWYIKSADFSSDSRMILIRSVGVEREEMMLDLELSPLKVNSEERIRNDQILYSRYFNYSDNSSILPTGITVRAGDITFNIKYSSLKLDTNSPTDHKVKVAL